MAPKQPNTGLLVGINKGHVVTKRELPARPSSRKGKRITELLKVGKDKRTLKVGKRKLGTHKRTKKKREEMANVLHKMRLAGHGHSTDKKK